MKQLAVWEANDGTLHRRRVDAAARDRELRRAEQGDRAVTSYLFAFDADATDENGDRIKCGRLPSNTDVADGLVSHYWGSRRGLSLDEAISAAIKRHHSLQRRWADFEWFLDCDARVFVMGKETGTVDMTENLTYDAAKLYR